MKENSEILYTEDRELTVNGFIRELQSIAATYRNMPIKIEAPNGMIMTPKAKLLLEDSNDIFSNVTGIIITID